VAPGIAGNCFRRGWDTASLCGGFGEVPALFDFCNGLASCQLKVTDGNLGPGSCPSNVWKLVRVWYDCVPGMEAAR
jgi:hypothetical protein